MDLKIKGSFLTYTNKKQGMDRVCTKIDRLLVNERWHKFFDNASDIFLPEGLMDHCPCIVSLFGGADVVKRPFRFFNMWTEFPGYHDIISQAWNTTVRGTDMFVLVNKLQAVKICLKQLNLSQFSNIETADTVAAGQEEFNGDPGNEDLIKAEYEVRTRYVTTHKAKFLFLKQKAKLHWLQDGDANSAYFHACLRSRRVHNRIPNISLPTGEITQDPALISDAFTTFYVELLGTHTSPQMKLHPTVIMEGVVLNEDRRGALCRNFREEDVKGALWSIDEDKALGPDGFSSRFFKNSWDVVKSHLCKAVLGFFEHGRLLK
ncbi:uncharacterized protein LOC110709206 [Chenopodium quinoa]|uniref:uncharacterized protein LOC110709206 n=1 Tax=Chenopodium quinoa TaxID=63459 RepID=UPI000B7959E1|nr:uncharacterized protein LOC110709206 [Chenopodium quinoa]